MNPFKLEDNDSYQRWRDARLAGYPSSIAEIIVEVADPRQLSPAEHQKLTETVERANMAIYASQLGAEEDKEIVRQMGRQFGMTRLDANMCADDDAISSLEQADTEPRTGYIPYTNRPIAWHTDGYYNAADKQIRAMVLHCVRAADTGGINQIFDPEIAYIRLRDENPDFITALMHPSAMTIPENREPNGKVRPASIGPVFEMNPRNGHLEMRYTARTRSIEWRDDATTHAAVAFLQSVLNSDDPLIQTIKMQDGDGLLCNNSLHNRTGFDANSDNASTRLMMRVRFHNRVIGRT